MTYNRSSIIWHFHTSIKSPYFLSIHVHKYNTVIEIPIYNVTFHIYCQYICVTRRS